MSFQSLKEKVAKFPSTKLKPMFGYDCFTVNGKFFVGFYRKNNYQVIARLSQEDQEQAIKKSGIKPAPQGARKGWIEINMKHVDVKEALKLVRKSYDHTLKLAVAEKKVR